MKIDPQALSGAQLLALLEYFAELDQARLAHQNGLLSRLQQHPDFNDDLRDLVNNWSVAGNAMSRIADAEIQRILASAAPDTPLN